MTTYLITLQTFGSNLVDIVTMPSGPDADRFIRDNATRITNINIHTIF